MSWIISNALMKDFENSLSSREQVAESLGESSLDGEPFAPLSGSHTPQAFLSPDRMTAFSRLSRFGMTFRPLTANLGEDVLTWFQEAFPAKTSAPPERDRASTANALECGWKWPESSVKFDPVSSSWKTRQCSLLEGLDEFLETWPRWGIMRDGECWELATLERPTSGSESGLWPTPTKADGGGGPGRSSKRKGGDNLRTAVALWPTPTVCGNYNRKGLSKTSGDGLATAVAMYPTPKSRDWKDGTSKGPEGWTGDLGKAVNPSKDGGSLNPTWVEWLMAWPLE